MRWLARVGVAAGVAVVALLIWGVAVEPRLILDLRQEEAMIPGLPESWEGARVALIADLQVGMWLGNTGMVRRIVAELVRRTPAVVLIAGDFVYQPTDEEDPGDVREDYDASAVLSELRAVEDLLRPLITAGIPTYAVLGNHDYGVGEREDVALHWLGRLVRERLTRLGVHVLHNEARAMAPAGGTARVDEPALHLVGIGPLLAGEARPEAALAGVPDQAPRIVFMHHPDAFARLPAGAAPLALAAHTHGGQVRLPFTPRWTWMSLAADDVVRADGWIQGFGQPENRLYVNRGIGFSMLPIRINCPPELTMFTLRRGPLP